MRKRDKEVRERRERIRANKRENEWRLMRERIETKEEREFNHKIDK